MEKHDKPGMIYRWVPWKCRRRSVHNVTEGPGFEEGAVPGRWAKATRVGGREASEGRVF